MKRLPFLLSLVFAIGASGPSSDGDAAFLRGDTAAAERGYAAESERTSDPGRVAFNLGVIHAGRKEYAEAERAFTRSLDDADAPTDRRSKALYNLGVCWLHRGGLDGFRTAVECFERCLSEPGAGGLEADARRDLELAKLLWAQARAEARRKPKIDDPPPNAPPDPKKPAKDERLPPGADDPNRNVVTPGTPAPTEPGGNPPPGQKPVETTKTVGGKGNLPVRVQAPDWRPQDESQAREFLKPLAGRLARDRRAMADAHAPPERPDVKDW